MTPSPTTFPLKPLPSGDWQTIQHSKLCKWLHCWGQIERKKGVAPGIEKQGETKRSGSVVWRGQGRIKGLCADLRPLSLRQSWLHLTSLWRPPKPTGISCYTGAMPYGDSVSLQALLLSHCLHLHPPPGTISQVKVDGRGWGVYVLRPNLSGIHDKESWALSPDARRPSLTLLWRIHMAFAPSLSWLHRENHSMKGIRTEKSSQSLTWGW